MSVHLKNHVTTDVCFQDIFELPLDDGRKPGVHSLGGSLVVRTTYVRLQAIQVIKG